MSPRRARAIAGAALACAGAALALASCASLPEPTKSGFEQAETDRPVWAATYPAPDGAPPFEVSVLYGPPRRDSAHGPLVWNSLPTW